MEEVLKSISADAPGIVGNVIIIFCFVAYLTNKDKAFTTFIKSLSDQNAKTIKDVTAKMDRLGEKIEEMGNKVDQHGSRLEEFGHTIENLFIGQTAKRRL